MRPSENFSIFRGGKILGTKGESRHIKDFDIVSDKTDEVGVRTLVFKPSDVAERLKLCKELANEIVVALGEGDNKLLRRMISDHLRDYDEKDIKEMHKLVMGGGVPIKTRESCFKIIIGDGRRRGHHEIQLID